MVEVMKIMLTSFKRSHARTATLSTLNPAADHRQAMSLQETPGHLQASLSQSLVGSLLLSPGSWRAEGFVCTHQESIYPVLCKLWWLYCGVNSDILQEDLCHTQVYCTQSPCPCRSPVLTYTPQETLKNSSVSVSVGSLGPRVHKVPLSPLSISGGYGV